MTDEFSYSDEIQAYLDQQMTEAQRQKFEADLLVNKKLKAEYDAHLATENALNLLAFNARLQRIKVNPPETTTIPLWRRWPVAAAVLLLVAVVTPLWYANSHYSNRALADNYYERPLVGLTKGSLDASDKVFQAKQEFAAGNFTAVINLLSTITESDSQYLESQFLLGTAYLESQDPASAIPPLQMIADSQDERRQRAEWYLLLAYVNLDDQDSFKKMSERIQGTANHYFEEDLKSLQQDLKSGWRRIVF